MLPIPITSLFSEINPFREKFKMDRIPLETMTACENSLCFSGWDSQVSTAGGPGSSLIWELRSRMPQVLAKNNKRKEKKFKRESLTAYLLQSLPGRAFFQNSSD